MTEGSRTEDTERIGIGERNAERYNLLVLHITFEESVTKIRPNTYTTLLHLDFWSVWLSYPVVSSHGVDEKRSTCC